jgi:transcriptional regulator with XRE-family HTH domain
VRSCPEYSIAKSFREAMLNGKIFSIAEMAQSAKDTVPPDIREAEGRALGKLIADWGTAKNLAFKAEIAESYLGQVKKGTRPLNLKFATRIAKALGTTIDRFSPRIAKEVSEAVPFISSSYAEVPLRSAFTVCERSAPMNQWPFKTLTPSEYCEISEEGKARLDALGKGMAIESMAMKKAS